MIDYNYKSGKCRSWWTNFRIRPEIRLQCGSAYFYDMNQKQTKLTLCFFLNLLQSHQKTEGWWKISWRDRKTTKIKWAVEWPLFWPVHPWPQRLALELTGEIQLTRSITQQLVSRYYFFLKLKFQVTIRLDIFSIFSFLFFYLNCLIILYNTYIFYFYRWRP